MKQITSNQEDCWNLYENGELEEVNDETDAVDDQASVQAIQTL